MLEGIKAMAVTKQHPAIHTLNLHGAKQTTEETLKTFAARVQEIAVICEPHLRCQGVLPKGDGLQRHHHGPKGPGAEGEESSTGHPEAGQ